MANVTFKNKTNFFKLIKDSVKDVSFVLELEQDACFNYLQKTAQSYATRHGIKLTCEALRAIDNQDKIVKLIRVTNLGSKL